METTTPVEASLWNELQPFQFHFCSADSILLGRLDLLSTKM